MKKKHASQKQASTEAKNTQPRRGYRQKLVYSALVMAAACLTLIFFGPFESVAFAGNAMSYDHRDIWWVLALTAGAVFAAGTFLLPLLKGKAFRCTVTAIFAVTLAGYLQSALMNGDLGLLDGHAFRPEAAATVFNALLWLGIIAVCFIVHRFSRPMWRNLIRIGSIALVVMQLASTVSIALGNHPTRTTMDALCLSDRGMYEYSTKDNIFVFVLDRLDYDYIEKVLAEDPSYFDSLDGFTGYTNAISAYARTQPALNQMLTGSETAFSCTKKDFYTDSWHEDGKQLLEDLTDLEYSIETYTNIKYLFSDPEHATKYVDNVVPSNTLKAGAVLPKLLQLGAFRWAPLALKSLFWADTNYYNEGVFTEGNDTAYQFRDSYYGAGFTDSTARRNTNAFKFYHFYGSHAPYTMNADGTASDEETTVTEQTMGIFLHLFNAFDRMKELGIYEDATILITADHGAAIYDTKPLQKATRIGLFYKPSGSSGTPLTLSAAPVCTDNISATIMKQAGLADYSAYGQALDDIAEDADLVRYYYKSVANKETYHEETLYTYAVEGDAANFDNWTLIETTPIQKENRFY